jgi:hypothetical protein
VRQLKNVTEGVIVRARSPAISLADLPPEIRNAPAAIEAPVESEQERASEVIFNRMVQGRESFWMVPYALFMARDISRSDMREIIEQGLRKTAGSYKELPELFNIPAADYKRLLSFLRQHQCHVPFQQFRRTVTPPKLVAAQHYSVERRWPRKPISDFMPAELASAKARVLDIGYGGLRLAVDDDLALPREFDVTLPYAGVRVTAHRAWSSRSPAAEEFWFGVEVNDWVSDIAWRDFVDSTR